MDGGRDRISRQVTGGVNDKTIINSIMQRFRPIAPKPVAGGSGYCESATEKKTYFVTKERPKRKYVRSNKNQCKTNEVVEKEKKGSQQRLHQISGQKGTSTGGSSGNYLDLPAINPVQQLPVRSNFDRMPENRAGIGIDFSGSHRQVDLTGVMPPTRAAAAESRVTVGCVTDACMEGGGLGMMTDVEKIKSLEVDTCPGFVTDSGNMVWWINPAYRRMVWEAEEGGESPPDTAVQLVVKEELPGGYPAFACRVRVEYTWRKVKQSRIMPCDVWRMDFGGFAWRLDLKAALSLGR
ncbi:hypothetical protein U1Q18_038222 [Sarracenia purpurea var. burkii]